MWNSFPGEPGSSATDISMTLPTEKEKMKCNNAICSVIKIQ